MSMDFTSSFGNSPGEYSPTADAEDEAQPQPTTGILPVLQYIAEGAGTGGATSDWANEVATRLNDYHVQKSIADTSTAAGNLFVKYVDTFKQGLMQGVQNDPTFLPTALSVVPPTIQALTQDHDPDAADAITAHMHEDLTRAAIQAMAAHNPVQAAAMIRKYGGLLNGDENFSGMVNYVGGMAQAKQADHDIGYQQGLDQKVQAQETDAASAIQQLYDPSSYKGWTMPDKWNQDNFANTDISAQNTRLLDRAVQRLNTNGDPQTSNPDVALAALKTLADGGKVPAGMLIGSAGQALRMRDINTINRLAYPLGDDGKPTSVDSNWAQTQQATASQLYSVAMSARDQLWGRNRENGVVGQIAFQNYFNWMMDQWRRGAGILDPSVQSAKFQTGGGAQPSYLGDPSVVMPFLKQAVDQIHERQSAATLNTELGQQNNFGVAVHHGGATMEAAAAARQQEMPAATAAVAKGEDEAAIRAQPTHQQQTQQTAATRAQSASPQPARQTVAPRRVPLNEIFGNRYGRRY